MKKNRVRSISLWFLLLALTAGSIYYFYAYGPKMLDEMVTEFVDDTVEAQITELNLPVDSFRVSFDEQELILYNYDLLKHAYSGQGKDALGAKGVSLVLDSVIVTGINWQKLYLDSILLIDNIRAVSSKLSAPSWIADSLKIPNISKIKAIQIAGLSMNVEQVSLLSKSGSRYVSSVLVSSVDVLADSMHLTDQISCKSWSAETEGMRMNSWDGIHDLSVGSSSIKDDLVKLSRLSFKSKYSLDNLAQSGKDENTIFNISLPSLTLEIPVLLDVLNGNRLTARELRLDRLDVKMLTNLGIDRKSARRMIQDFIFDLPIAVEVDKLEISNSSVDFLLRKPGFADNEMSFASFYATLNSLYSTKRKLAKDNMLNVNLKAQFNGHVPFNMTANIDMSSPAKTYSYKGHLGAMNLTELRPVLVAMKDMTIKEGKLINLDWDIQANSSSASGWLDFEYDDLKMGQNNKKGIKDVDLLKFVATKLLISSNNLHGQYFVRGKVAASRAADESMFINMWEALFSGIESTLKP